MTNQPPPEKNNIDSIICHLQTTKSQDESKINYMKTLADRFDANVEVYLEGEGEMESSDSALDHSPQKQILPSKAYNTLVNDSQNVDLLVTGTATIGQADHPEIFSSTMQLAKDAECPVMLIPDKMRASNKMSLSRPLLICNSDEDVVAVMSSVLPFLKESYVSILISHYKSYKDGANALRGQHDLADFLQLNNITCQLISPDTNGLDELDSMINEINNGQYDFVIMRAYGRSNMRDLFLGLLPRAIIGRARLPVLLAG